jgi:hypothetical protein
VELDGILLSQRYKVGQSIRVFSAKDCHGKPKYPAFEQYVDLEGTITYVYHARYGPILLDGIVGSDDIYFYNVLFEGEFNISIPEEMLEAP